MANTTTEVGAAVPSSSNVRDLNRPSVKRAMKDITEASVLMAREQAALAQDAQDLKTVAVDFAKELARPTPSMLKAVVAVVKAQTAIIREVRGYVGSLAAALPGMTAAMRSARDMAGAYSVDELYKS